MSGSWMLFIAVPVGLVALAVWLDRRTRRGYGLGFLAVVLLALDIWGTIVIGQAIQQADSMQTDNFAEVLVLVVFALIGLYFTFVLVLGGLVEVVSARHWRWLALILALSIVPASIVLAPGTALVPDVLGALGLSRDAEYLALLFVPTLVTLAYAISRVLRPVGPQTSPEHP